VSASVDVVIIGAGHSGLAMSHVLAARGIEHVLLERSGVANAWRTERWDSLRLLTPNWMTRLPGLDYQGDDPHGYMSAIDVADLLSAYAARGPAPVHTGTTVTRASPIDGGWHVETNRGPWRCRALVIASGAFSRPVVPALAALVPPGIEQLTAHSYRNPRQLAPGGVLVVGGSASGLQLAQEIRRSGRDVTLAVGEHVRLPRVYRGRDVQWWMLASGVLDERIEDADDPVRARHVPSPQLAGSAERASLDLNGLRLEGVRIVGRLMGVRGGQAQFSGSLHNVCALADLKMNRLLDRLDAWALPAGVADDTLPPHRFEPTALDARPLLSLDLAREVSSVVWATGLRPDHRWLDAPVFDRHGDIRHHGGIVDGAEGLVVLGLPFLRRRKSSFIHGAGDDARELAAHVQAHLDRAARRPAPSARTPSRSPAVAAASSGL
jgi:putative flavoprotein involved in K+ transport